MPQKGLLNPCSFWMKNRMFSESLHLGQLSCDILEGKKKGVDRLKKAICRAARGRIRLTALLLSLSMLLTTLGGCTLQPALLPTDQQFDQVEYRRPDGEAVLELIAQAQKKAQEDFLPFGLIASLRKISSATQEFYGSMAIAQVRNYADVNDSFYSEEMEYLNRWDARIQNAYDQLFEQIEASRFGSMSDRIFGESGVEDLQMSAQASSQAILSLQEQEKELEAQYYYTYAQATVETPEGEVLYADLEPEGQQAYYESFIQRYSAQMGELFMQLVQLRRQMAQALGYESYTRVADLEMLRIGYTREEIRSFREQLKQTLAPVYRSYLEDFYHRAENRTQPGYVYLLEQPAPTPQGNWQQTLEGFEELYTQMDEQMGECFSYLLSHQMIDAAPSASKANVTFSTMLYTLNTPFLFANMDGSEQDVFSISHEFGHCFAMWQQLKAGSHSEGRSMDVCEIHSQAMQLLIFPYYEIFYGDQAQVARRYDVYTMAAGILTAALNDEFQEKIYNDPTVTAEQLDELYYQLAQEYGLVVSSPYVDANTFAKSWFTTNQYFDTPFYAIDYALSGCVAMQFLQLMQQDEETALQLYHQLVQQPSDLDFLSVLQTVGDGKTLRSPFEEGQLEALAEQLQAFLDGDGQQLEQVA